MLSNFRKEGVNGASIHVLSPTPSGAGVALRVSNIRQIEASFGWQASRAIVQRIKLVLEQQLDVTDLDDTEFGVFSFFLPAKLFLILGLGGGNVEDGLSLSLQTIILSVFLQDDAICALPVVQVAAAVAGESGPLVSTRDRLLALARCAIRALGPNDRNRAGNIEAKLQYREQALRATSYLTGLLSTESCELAVPIMRANGRTALYNSLSLHITSADGGNCPLSEGYDDVVAMGLVRAVDEMRVMRAIRTLVADPLLSLGVQIAGASAVMDHWWSSIFAELDHDRSVAARLFVEIQPPTDPFIQTASIEFCREMRSRGVVIVLDRFGAGGSSLRDILVLQPDYVKIEESFLWRARDGMESFQTLKHLVGLALSLKAPAIVAGVNSDALASTATDAGAVWQCGDNIGMPFKPIACNRLFENKVGDGDA